MSVMSAGMHFPRYSTLVRTFMCLLDIKCIYVSPQHNRLIPCKISFNFCIYARLSDTLMLNSKLVKLLLYALCGAELLLCRLRVHVEISSQIHNILMVCHNIIAYNFFKLIHTSLSSALTFLLNFLSARTMSLSDFSCKPKTASAVNIRPPHRLIFKALILKLIFP